MSRSRGGVSGEVILLGGNKIKRREGRRGG